MEQPFNEKESLKLINEMIGRAKQSYVTKGIASIVWGAIIVVCSLVTWSQIKFNFSIGFDIWLLLIVAMIVQIFYAVKEKRSKNFVSHNEEAISYTWMAFGICIFIISFYNSKYDGIGEGSTLFMMIYGMPTYITGAVSKFKPMILGGIACWVFSIFSIYTPLQTDILLMAACGFFAWLIPGIILWQQYQKQQRADV